MSKIRCKWADSTKLYQDYHDNEWGKQEHDDRKLFEMLSLEIFQAGLSWITILNKREDFKIAFDNFEPNIVANYTNEKYMELLNNEKIIRNKLKISATINNAQKFLELQKEYGSFDTYIWNFVGNTPLVNTKGIIPARTELSDSISKDLKKRGFEFLGSIIVYSYLQAIGIVNDHSKECYLYNNYIKD